jgi:YVTN family beta-propeller protein
MTGPKNFQLDRSSTGRVSLFKIDTVVLAATLLFTMGAAAAPFAYITGDQSNMVSVIDTASNTVVTDIAMSGAGYGVAIHPIGSPVYVTNIYSDAISVIDTANNDVLTLPARDEPVAIAVHPEGTRLYVANRADASVSVIETTTYSEIALVAVGASPAGVAVHPSGAWLYVTNQLSDSVSVIDTNTHAVVKTIQVSSLPAGIAVHPNGTFVYVANTTSGAPTGSISVIETLNHTVVKTIEAGGYPAGVTVLPDGSRVYVSNNASNTVSVIETGSHAVIGTIAGFSVPHGIAAHPSAPRVYVANEFFSSTVSIIDTGTNTISQEVTMPAHFNNHLNAWGHFISPVPRYSCTGFEAPFNEPILLKARVNRAIPLRMKLFSDSTPITDFNIAEALPVVNVSFSTGGGPAVDVTDQLEPLSQASEGNSFRYDSSDEHWVFNLGTKPYKNAGTYTVTVKPGGMSYGVSPTCTGQFVRSS